MRIQLILPFLLLSSSLYALVPENFLGFDPLWVEKIGWKSKLATLYRQGKEVDLFTPVAKKNYYWKKSNFPVTPYFRPAARFWFNTYAAYSSTQVVIHHKERLAQIYKVLDFSELHRQVREPFVAYSLQNDITLQESFKIKRQLHFKDEASANLLRCQTGQREHFRQGLHNFGPYVASLEKIITSFKLPIELLALAFIESNFDTHASSSAGAEGVWQFMAPTARSFMRVDDAIDYRRNPLLSSYGAFSLLAQNKMILKRWDLAVTAYNAGTPHLVRARRHLTKIRKVDSLENIFANYSHPQLGFAVQNYYSAFLAMSHLLPLRHNYFAKLKDNKELLLLYQSKVPLVPQQFFEKLPSDSYITSNNRHFRKITDPIGLGALIVTSTKLHPSRYQLLDLGDYKRINALLKNN